MVVELIYILLLHHQQILRDNSKNEHVHDHQNDNKHFQHNKLHCMNQLGHTCFFLKIGIIFGIFVDIKIHTNQNYLFHIQQHIHRHLDYRMNFYQHTLLMFCILLLNYMYVHLLHILPTQKN